MPMLENYSGYEEYQSSSSFSSSLSGSVSSKSGFSETTVKWVDRVSTV